MHASIKSILRPFIPNSMIKARQRFLAQREVKIHDAIFHNKEPKHIFSEIYAKGMWGKVEDSDSFCSGHGSHLPVHVDLYVAAVSEFLRGFPSPLNVVDCGCGDFNVGSQIRQYCSNYVACDIVPDLIARNKILFKNLNVDFRVVNIIEDELPSGDVVIIRQVLQHLSNEHIKQFVNKIRRYRYLILTEYVPGGEFVPNIDQPTGAFSRLARGIQSGIVLTKEPFLLKAISERTICTTHEQTGLLYTVVYELSENE